MPLFLGAGLFLLLRFFRRCAGQHSPSRGGTTRRRYAYASVNGKPDQYCIESWVKAPSHSVPDSNINAYMRSARDFFPKFAKPSSP